MNQPYFRSISQDLFKQLNSDEHLSLEFRGEDSFFLRFNGGKVRQNTLVNEGSLYFRLVRGQRTISGRVPLSGNKTLDDKNSQAMLSELREAVKTIPEDPFAVVPQNYGRSETVIEGQVPDHLEIADAILTDSEKLDMTGIYAAGKIFRATADSAGSEHWFEIDNFNLDYSLISPSEKMAKGNYSGSNWDQKLFFANRELCGRQLAALEKPVKKIEPGKYKTYLAPGAMAEILGMLAYRGFSTQGLKQRQSPLLMLVDGKAKLSEKLNLRENFALGLDTPFNESGELAPSTLDLLAQGKLLNTLTNRRSAKEFDLESNGAGIHEMLRSPEILPGPLKPEQVLGELQTGLYLNRLHYLNWSELNAGRLTGMTRYACFWVEDGEWKAPIENLRFDDTIYNLLGNELVDFTATAEVFAETTTYERRQLGGCKTPGALIRQMNFTL